MLILVSVNDLRIRIPVGFHPEEVQIKTDVLITVKIKYQSDEINDNLNHTVDYQKIGETIKELSSYEFKLLETFAEKLINLLFEKFKHLNLNSISVLMKKSHILEAGLDASRHEVFVEKIAF